MSIGAFQILGIALTVALILCAGLLGSRRVRSADDFINASGRCGCWVVVGSIMGSLVSGQATVGTAQLAFRYGLSAIWFTFGCAIGCAILGLGYAAPLRRRGSLTLMEVVATEYGKSAETIGSLFTSIGIFLSVIAQILSSVALLISVFSIGTLPAALLAASVMALYVVTGGSLGTGLGGIVKLILLYVSSIAACIVATYVGGSLMPALSDTLVGQPLGALLNIDGSEALRARFFNPVARGINTDVGSVLSLTLGIVSTQTYAQAIWSAKSDSVARKAAMIAALLTPPIGLACTFVGLFMRTRCLTTEEATALLAMGSTLPESTLILSSSAQVFPMFIIHFMPPLLSGITLGTLLITNVAGGTGLSLGTATILARDLYFRFSSRAFSGPEKLRRTRIILLLVLGAAALTAAFVPQAIINDFDFLSMGLRSAGVFLPISCALFLPGRIHPRLALAAILCGPIAVLLAKILGLSLDPLFCGMGTAAICMLAGLRRGKPAL